MTENITIEKQEDPLTQRAGEIFNAKLSQDKFFKDLVEELNTIIAKSLPRDYLVRKVNDFNIKFINQDHVDLLMREAESKGTGFYYGYFEVARFSGQDRAGNKVEIKIYMSLDGKSCYAEL